MLCPHCNTTRIENEAPCSYCGAPSPLLGRSQVSGRESVGPVSAAWGSSNRASTEVWDHPTPPVAPEVSMVPNPASSWAFNPGPQSQLSWGTQSPEMSAWGQNADPQPQSQQSLLPVPYQGGTALQQGYQSIIPIQTTPDIERLLPAIPDEQGRVYVPPIYTKPRPIIPRYRAISGLLSVLIVSLMLCAGGGYYAQASGKLDALKRLAGAAVPRSLQPPVAGQQLPDPPNKVDMGPVADIIPSAATTLRVDSKTNIALQAQNTFKAGIPFYVTYSVKPDKVGTVMVKWYMNNLYFGTAQSKPIDPKTTPTVNGDAPIVFAQPAEGKVELYWNGQLAQRLYFVVR